MTGAKVDGSMIDSISNVMAVKLYANLPQEIASIDKDIQLVVKNDRRLQWKNLKVNFGQRIEEEFIFQRLMFGLKSSQ